MARINPKHLPARITNKGAIGSSRVQARRLDGGGTVTGKPMFTYATTYILFWEEHWLEGWKLKQVEVDPYTLMRVSEYTDENGQPLIEDSPCTVVVRGSTLQGIIRTNVSSTTDRRVWTIELADYTIPLQAALESTDFQLYTTTLEESEDE